MKNGFCMVMKNSVFAFCTLWETFSGIEEAIMQQLPASNACVNTHSHKRQIFPPGNRRFLLARGSAPKPP